jgi:DNA-binding NarL/FixJ family response regulator
MAKVRVLVADDHSIFRDGVKFLLSRNKNIKVVGEATNGNEAIELYTELLPDILIIDISMTVKTGMEASQEIIQKYKEAKIIILSMYDDEDYIDRCIELGVKGYVVKSESGKELELAVDAVVSEKNYYSHRVQEVIFKKHSLSINRKSRLESTIVKFTVREEEIIDLIKEGLTSLQIADKLYISPRTVETHRANLLKKLGVKNSIELIKKAEKMKA